MLNQCYPRRLPVRLVLWADFLWEWKPLKQSTWVVDGHSSPFLFGICLFPPTCWDTEPAAVPFKQKPLLLLSAPTFMLTSAPRWELPWRFPHGCLGEGIGAERGAGLLQTAEAPSFALFHFLKAKPHLLEHGYKSVICVHLRSCVTQLNWIVHKSPSIWPEVLTRGSLWLRGDACGCKLSDGAWVLFSSLLKCPSIINLLVINVPYINAQAVWHSTWAHSSGNWASLEPDAV